MHPKILLQLLQHILPALEQAAQEAPDVTHYHVEGLRVELPGGELIDRLRATAKELRTPVGQQRQLKNLPRIVDSKMRDETHQMMLDAATRIDFIADHLDPDAIFKLTHQEFIELQPLLGLAPLFIAVPHHQPPLSGPSPLTH